jgi:CheY-like chemotaxis protein
VFADAAGTPLFFAPEVSMATDTGEGNQPHARSRLRRFQELMRYKVQHILLVSSLYDSFILAEDGQLNEALLREYLELNLSQNPDLTRVSTGDEALSLARSQTRFDMIISTLRVGDMDAAELARRARQQGLEIPIIVLAYNNRELTDFVAKQDLRDLDRIFLW